MEWMAFFGCFFLCLGMVQRQEDLSRHKLNLNIVFGLCVCYQRALIIRLRKWFGVEALGLPCMFALGLLVVWSALSSDIFMWYFTGLWFIFFLHRRWQSLRFQEHIYSFHDGWPTEAMRICKDEFGAKLSIEPILVGFAGAFAKWFYEQRG
jgi:hypothetical protein